MHKRSKKELKEALGRTSQRQALRAAAVLAVAVLVPCICQWHLGRQIRKTLEPILTVKIGSPTSVDHLGVSGAGEIQLTGVSSELFSAARLDVSFTLSSILRGKPSVSHVQIFEPTFALNKKSFSHQPSSAGSADGGKPSPARTNLHLPPVTVADGTVRLVTGAGVANAVGVRTRPVRGGLRITARNIKVEAARNSDWKLEFESGPVSMDIKNDLTVRRFLLPRGALDITSKQNTLSSRRFSLHYGLEQPGAIGVEIQVESDKFKFQAQQSKDGLSGTVESDPFPSWALSGFLPWLGGEHGSLSGQIRFAKKADSFAAKGSISGDQVTIMQPRLSSTPLLFSGNIEGNGAFWWGSENPWRAQIQDTSVSLSGFKMQVEADMSGAPNSLKDFHGSVGVSIPRQPCEKGYAALTKSGFSKLAGMGVSGNLSTQFSLDLDPFGRGSTLSASFPELCRVDHEAPGGNPNILARPFLHQFPRKAAALWGPGTEGYVSLEELPAYVPHAFRLAEDGRFYQHRGFDSQQIARSIDDNIKNSRILRGGSTITQQLVKNIFLSNERTFARKLDEAIIAWRVEGKLTKGQILERYLNLCELGDHIYGIEAGANFWFGKRAQDLNPIETGFLVSLVPAPQTKSRRILDQGVDESIVTNAQTTLRRLKRAGILGSAEYRRAKKAPLLIRNEPTLL